MSHQYHINKNCVSCMVLKLPKSLWWGRRTKTPNVFAILLLTTIIAFFVGEQFFRVFDSNARESIRIKNSGYAPRQNTDEHSCSSKTRSEIDEEPIHVLMAMCMRNVMLKEDVGLTSMRSILAARDIGTSHNRRYVFHLVLNAWTAWLVNYNTSVPLPGGTALPKSFITTFHEV